MECVGWKILFREYLSGRHQYVDYNDAKSETKSVSMGVPQGSILGPLLFLICVASLQKGPHVAIYQSRENRS